MKRSFLSFVSPLALTCALTACGGEPTPEELAAEALAAEELGTASSALCTDAGAENYSGFLNMGDVGGEVSATSPTATYGSLACSGRYVVEATNTQQPNLAASASWGDSGLSQLACPNGRVSAVMYGYKNGTWYQLHRGELIGYGVWTQSPFGGGGYCDVSVGMSIDNTYSKVRVAAKASYGTASKRVTGSISAHY
jgi:hypothetical protein